MQWVIFSASAFPSCLFLFKNPGALTILAEQRGVGLKDVFVCVSVAYEDL